MIEHKPKRNYGLLFSGLAFGFLIMLVLLYFFAPQYLPLPQQKPVIPPKPAYEYYIILDEATNETLMYVSVITVNPGDELITEQNKRYVISRVEGNRAYARYVEIVDIKSKKEPIP